MSAAIETLGLDEVHHGIHAANSPGVMKFLADRKIILNVCPTSNIMLGYAKSYAEHPIKILVENGVPGVFTSYSLFLKLMLGYFLGQVKYGIKNKASDCEVYSEWG